MNKSESRKTVSLSLRYRSFDPQQVGIADDVPDSLHVSVRRGDNFGMKEVDVMVALEMALDRMKRKQHAIRHAINAIDEKK